jgi:hypothetical protein
MFHVPNYRHPTPSLKDKIWEFHDNHPLPERLNRIARGALHLIRRGQHAFRSPQNFASSRGNGNFISVPDSEFLKAANFKAMGANEAEAWFARVHEANESVYVNGLPC